MDSGQLALYPLALLKLLGEEASAENLPLGTATRAGRESSRFRAPAHRVLEALINHSPSPDTIAGEFLVQLGKCGISVVESLVEAVCSCLCTDTPGDWAVTVHQHLKERGADLTRLTQLANHYFSHLVIAFRNPGGIPTPQDSICPSPDLKRMEEIEELLRVATHNRSQSALKDLVTRRDGLKCLLTGLSFLFPQPVAARCAHIIPFSVQKKTQTHSAIEMFTGQTLSAKFILQYINDPRNALLLEGSVHDSMDNRLAWGIEARFSDDQWKYYYRIVRENAVSPLTKLADGEEIIFGRGVDGSDVPFPDPMICNLHLAVARVSHACGASEVFDQFPDDDDEDACDVSVRFGGPFMSDEDACDLPVHFQVGVPFTSDDMLMHVPEVLAYT